MSYTLNRGIEGEGLDNTQRGLLIGLPAIALILSFGAVHRHSVNNPAGSSPNTIPVVSSLSAGSGSGGSDATKNNPGTASPANNSSTSPLASSSGSSSTGTSGGTGIVGGMGGGPAGGGSTTIPDCSIGQIATVNCMVPACSPAVTLTPGQKAVLGLGGTCVVVN